MTGYRFFFVGKDGHITKRVEQEFVDDVTAIEYAETLADGADVEVWAAARYVGRIKRDNRPLDVTDQKSL